MTDMEAVRINGRMLNSYKGRRVIVMGEVIQQDKDRYFLRTSDGMEITAYLQPGEYINSKFAQFTGTVGADGILVVETVHSTTDNFNMANYDKYIQLTNNSNFEEVFA
mmetsp:Transcript_23163/g.23373  ORF Transcript_23163/g.23373 Transcript_23163/m.23373 type:complete len:108 (-) Transcript_23163:121-444(-)|eukprot:CAMPEP_0182418146 /NCGR_PEP_ID=MMETSP1167-20130531/2612_1 /TAXON_ID=2988 /ORGANISM="Mallomonas Sp, Strain CCMP3275" /LENGTH=107 /DNA_ID=CAMNT_0024592179 /DNA_START=103 /DNA_END=426 /DNA_ORIENTATION=+